MTRRLVLSVLLLMLTPAAAQAAAPAQVVVSIAPIHSLAAAVMEGVAEPSLLVAGDRSPHQYMLKPSQMVSLQRADLVVWVGPGVESFLPHVLDSLGTDVQVMELLRLPGMTLLPARAGGVWEAHAEDGDHADSDAHLWLDPHNAARIVAALVDTLGAIDGAHAERYRANGAQLQQRLETLDRRLREQLAPVRDVPYLVFHDAYQYFEKRYDLNPVGAVMIDPERKPGARRLSEIRDRIAALKVKCVFSEPQFPDKLMRVVTENSGIDSATLDPMGMDLPPGPELYFVLMRRLGQELAACLQGDSSAQLQQRDQGRHVHGFNVAKARVERFMALWPGEQKIKR